MPKRSQRDALGPTTISTGTDAISSSLAVTEVSTKRVNEFLRAVASRILEQRCYSAVSAMTCARGPTSMTERYGMFDRLELSDVAIESRLNIQQHELLCRIGIKILHKLSHCVKRVFRTVDG
jgi:hypothetical protein